MGPTWGRQDPGGSHVGPMNLAIWEVFHKILQWRHNERDGVSNHRRPDGVHNRLFRHRSKKSSKLRVTGVCEGNSPVISEFPAQRASNTEKFPSDDVIMKIIICGTFFTLNSSFFIQFESTCSPFFYFYFYMLRFNNRWLPTKVAPY